MSVDKHTLGIVMKRKAVPNLGAWPSEKGVSFRVWAPAAKKAEVVLLNAGRKSELLKLERESGGYFFGLWRNLQKDALYKFRLDGKEAYPDPCSRYQPDGPHGPSMVIDPRKFKWHDDLWQKRGLALRGQVLYELHVGTFSRKGSFLGVKDELAELKRLGVTVIELMPLAEFPGRWNWGYDGVSLFAPAHVYGRPDDLRELVDAAHRLGLGVILDVVYNHLGPDGNYLKKFSKNYFTDRYQTDWGEALNFEGLQSRGTRTFFIRNALMWLTEFHFDGLRLDATQNIYDESKVHILAEIAYIIRKEVEPKKIILIAENEPQDSKLISAPDKNGWGLDAMWNDDFHHAATVALTGRREAYYTDYLGRSQEFIAMLKYGFLYQGQFYQWQNQPRGTPIPEEIRAEQLIVFLQNHDQIANSLTGRRIHEHDAARYRALTALWLLSPQTPMFFMGQEFASSSPFLFFTDHDKELASKVSAGRKEFLSQFPSIKSSLSTIADPQDPHTFEQCKLNFEERKTHRGMYALHRDLLKMRREDTVFCKQDHRSLDGAVLSDKTFAVRYRDPESDRLLVINLGDDVDFSPCPEPLLAPLSGRPWQILWSSEDVRYGGQGVVRNIESNGWIIPGRCAQVFASNGLPLRLLRTTMGAAFDSP